MHLEGNHRKSLQMQKKTKDNIVDYVYLCEKYKDLTAEENENIDGNLRTTRDLGFKLPPDTFRFVSYLPTAHDIRERLKELYFGYTHQTHSIQTTSLSEFDSFRQKASETVDQVPSIFNHLLRIMLKYGIKRETIKENLTVMNKLRST